MCWFFTNVVIIISHEAYVRSQLIKECDETKHLGILRSVNCSFLPLVLDRCKAARSAFYSLFPVAPRAGGIHPITSFRLYSAICLPILLYGCELWNLSQSHLLLLERVHRKILRSFQGLPVRCPVAAVLGLLGARSVVSLISQRQLCFALSFSFLDPDALPRRVFALRLNSHGSGSVLSVWSSLLARYFLPSLSHIFVSPVSQSSWRRFIRSLLASYHHLDIVDGCSHLLLGRCTFSIGCVAPHWRVTLSNVAAARASLFRIQLLVGCGGLAVDSARFRGAVSSACPLCGSPREDAYHFAVVCPLLADIRVSFLSSLPPSIASNSAFFFDVLMGIRWISDSSLQLSLIHFLCSLRRRRSFLLS